MNDKLIKIIHFSNTLEWMEIWDYPGPSIGVRYVHCKYTGKHVVRRTLEATNVEDNHVDD